jgi:PII-like signaling protein
MIARGAAKKLVIYVNEMAQHEGQPVYEAVVRFLHRHGCAGATVTRAIAGYGASGRMHQARAFSLTDDVPMRIEVVESERKINALMPFIYEMVEHGLIEVQDTEIIKHTTADAQTEESGAMKHEKLEGSAKMLRIYIGEDDRWEGEPLHEAIVKRLRMLDIAGATVYRGVMGYGAQQRVHKSGWLGLSTDLPLMIAVIDTEEKIRRVLPVLDEMVDEGLIAISDVEIIKYTHSRGKSANDASHDDEPRESAK